MEEPFENVEESSLERVKKKLYMRGKKEALPARSALEDRAYSVERRWHPEGESVKTTPSTEEDPVEEVLRSREKMESVIQASKRGKVLRTVQWFFGVSLLFFLGAVGGAWYLFTQGKNQVSCDKIAISFDAPSSVASGKELNFSVNVVNQNLAHLEDAEIVVLYPEGARSVGNTSLPLPLSRERIGTLEAGKSVRAYEKVVLFSPEQSTEKIQTTIEYGMAGSSGRFSCEAVHVVHMDSSPVSVSVSGFSSVSSGQETVLAVTVTSNAEETLPHLRLIAEYPPGFVVTKVSPQTTSANTWDIGDMNPRGVYHVTIAGVVHSQGEVSRLFKFRVGEKDAEHPTDIVAPLSRAEHEMKIGSPFFSLDLTINNSSDETIPIYPNSLVNATMRWKNTLSYPLYDVSLSTHLDPSSFVPESVTVQNGYFRSRDATILWSPQTTERLRTVEPGAEGVFAFSFKSGTPSAYTQNKTTNLSFSLSARKEGSSAPEEQTLENQAQHTLQFISILGFDSYLLFKSGPFQNTGEHPPLVDAETTYTVVWDVSNTTNDVDGVEVRAKLPVYARFMGIVTPATEKVSFDEITDEVVWSLGTVSAGTGSRLQKRTVSFVIGVTPSLGDRGKTLSVVGETTIRGTDRFTGTRLSSTLQRLDTEIKRDPLLGETSSLVR